MHFDLGKRVTTEIVNMCAVCAHKFELYGSWADSSLCGLGIDECEICKQPWMRHIPLSGGRVLLQPFPIKKVHVAGDHLLFHHDKISNLDIISALSI